MSYLRKIQKIKYSHIILYPFFKKIYAFLFKGKVLLKNASNLYPWYACYTKLILGITYTWNLHWEQGIANRAISQILIWRMQTSCLHNAFYVTWLCILICNVVTICIISFYMTRHMYIGLMSIRRVNTPFHVAFAQSNKISQAVFWRDVRKFPSWHFKIKAFIYTYIVSELLGLSNNMCISFFNLLF